MTMLAPPDRLPAGYREVWARLAEAARAAPSRQALARELGVATQTLQRLLVTGDVPRFDADANRREVRAWCRTLTRLARHFGVEPRVWIEAVGIQWDDVVAAAVGRVAAGGHAQPHDPTGDAADPLRGIRRSRPPTVRVGFLGYHHFASPLFSFSGSFFGVYVERLLRSIDPTWRIEMINHWISDLAEGVVRDRDPLHLVMAMFDTAERRSRGLDFVSLPGWRIRHSAIWIRPRDHPGPTPHWREVTDPRRSTALFHVLDQQAAHVYLKGQCGFGDDAFIPRRRPRRPGVRDFWEISLAHPHRWVIHVNEETSCCRVMEDLRRLPGFDGEFVVEEIDGAPDECPRYDLGIAIRAGASDWRSLIEAVQETELYGNAAATTARLYAEVMARGVMDRGSEPSRIIPARSPWSPEPFDLAGPLFRDELHRHLIRTLETAYLDRLRRREPARRPSDLNDAVEAAAREQAARLIPRDWQTALVDARPALSPFTDAPVFPRDEVPVASPVPRVVCHSCGSLLGVPGDPEHPFCPACASPSGARLGRIEVQTTLAGWLRDWQPGLSEAESMARADRILSAMPGWADER